MSKTDITWEDGMREEHYFDDEFRPAGGLTTSLGLNVQWQDGPVRVAGGRNGAQVEDVLSAALRRLDWLNTTSGKKYECRENSQAITHIEEAMHWLYARTTDREARGVEGTHKV